MDIKSKVNSFFFLQIGDTYSVRVRTKPIIPPSPPSYPLILIHQTDSKGHKQDKQITFYALSWSPVYFLFLVIGAYGG